MAPAPLVSVLGPLLARGLPQPKEPNNHERKDESLDEIILEAWSQGFLVGGLIVLIMITVANMRRGVLLHKLILIELIMALGHGTFIFTPDPIYGWHLSATAIFLYLSWYLHNIVAWMKNKPFLPHWGSMLYIGTVVLIFPYWICEMYYNFAYFNALGNDGFRRTRPWEALARDPWWIFTTCNLIYVIKREYKFGLIELIRASPRFGVLIFSMLLSIVFLLTDVIVTVAHIGGPSGINPYWKLALVFKCAADALFLDDFKKVLDVLITHTLQKVANPANGRPQTMQINNHDNADYDNNNNNNNNNGNNAEHQRGDSSARTDSEAPEITAIAKQDFGLQPIHPIITSESYGTIVPAARARSFDGSCSGDDDLKGSHRHANIFNMPGFNRRRRSSDESFGNWDDLPQDMTPIPPPAAAPAPEIAPITPPMSENPRPSREWQQTFHQKQGLAPFRSPPGPSGRHSAVEWYDVTRGPRPPGATSPARSEPRMNTSPTRIEPRSDPGYDSRSDMRYEPAVGFAREDTPPPVPNRSPARSVRTPDGSTHSGTLGGRVGTPDGSTHSGRLANRGGLGGNVI